MAELRKSPMKPVAALAAVGTIAMLVSGCYEDIGAARYEPGVYKGAADPLIERMESGEPQEQLRQRFEIAARDR